MAAGRAVPPDQMIVSRAAIQAIMALSCLLAAGYAALTDLESHRIWGLLAAGGYIVAWAVAQSSRVSTARVIQVAAIGATLVPAAVLVGTGIRQIEVDVIEHSAHVLLTTNSPYLTAPPTVDDVNPYLPAMALFGLPRQLFGTVFLGDARIWFLLTFVAALAAAAAIGRNGGRLIPRSLATPRDDFRSPMGLVWAALACPFVALQLAVAGHDLPVIGLMCLGLALATGDRAVAAGLVLGVAASLKQSAWPAIAVVVVFMAVCLGRKAAVRCASASSVVVAAAFLPVLLGASRSAALDQTAGFPLAVGPFDSPAASPLPGVLLSSLPEWGHVASLILLVSALGGMITWLMMSPPHSLSSAVSMLAIGETLAALVLPASRFGYVVYPTVLVLWAIWIRFNGNAAFGSALPKESVEHVQETGLVGQRRIETS